MLARGGQLPGGGAALAALRVCAHDAAKLAPLAAATVAAAEPKNALRERPSFFIHPPRPTSVRPYACFGGYLEVPANLYWLRMPKKAAKSKANSDLIDAVHEAARQIVSG
jgi:hypothetical protein